MKHAILLLFFVLVTHGQEQVFSVPDWESQNPRLTGDGFSERAAG